MKKLVAFGIFAALYSQSLAQAMEVSFEEDPSLPIVYLSVAVKAGAVNDPPGLSGLTNFMGEMLMRGTKSRTKEQIDLAIDQMGAQLVVETKPESMTLKGAVLSAQLEPFMKLLSELLTEPSFPEIEIGKLRSEISSGILEELGHDPMLGSRRFNLFLFGAHPYGNPILGKLKDVEAITQAKIQEQYDRLIRDQNLLVIGTGQADSRKIDSFADRLAGARPNLPGVPAIGKVAAPKAFPGRRLQIVDKPDRTQTQINGGQIGVRMTDPDFFPLHLGNYAFGGPSFSAILMVEIRVKRGWSYGANSYFKQGRQPKSWQFHLFPAAKDTANALTETLKLVSDLQVHGITQEQFEFSKRSVVNSAGFMYNTPRKRMENKLLEKTLDLPDGFFKSYGPEVEKLELTQVNKALHDFLKPETLAISVLGTAKDLKEPLAKAAGVPVDQVQVVPYTQE
ncbi:MAG: M16 family metallopeptidase [Bdellovibrionota bacterium]